MMIASIFRPSSFTALAALWSATAAGLLLALFEDGLWDVASWIALAAVIGVGGYLLFRKPTAGPPPGAEAASSASLDHK